MLLPESSTFILWRSFVGTPSFFRAKMILPMFAARQTAAEVPRIVEAAAADLRDPSRQAL